MEDIMSIKGLLGFTSLVLGLSLISTTVRAEDSTTEAFRADATTIAAHIKIAGEDVSGMTKKQADEVIEKKIKE